MINLKEYIELCSREIKPADVSSVVEVIRLNKSIRVSKNILHNVIAHMSEEDSHNLYIFSLDIIGKVIILSLSGYAYSIRQHEDIVTAVKLVDDNMFCLSITMILKIL